MPYRVYTDEDKNIYIRAFDNDIDKGKLLKVGKTTRRRKLLNQIGQAHLLPRMSLSKLKNILEKYNVTDWEDIGDSTISKIIDNIKRETENDTA